MSFDPLSEQVMGIGIILTTLGFFLVFGVSAYRILRQGQGTREAVIISYDHQGEIIDLNDPYRVGDFFTTRNKFNSLLTQCHELFGNLDLNDDVVSEALENDKVPDNLSHLRYFLADAGLQFAILEGQAVEGDYNVDKERDKLEACYAFVRDIHIDRLYLDADAASRELIYDVDFEIIDFGMKKADIAEKYGLRNPARDYFAKDTESAEGL